MKVSSVHISSSPALFFETFTGFHVRYKMEPEVFAISQTSTNFVNDNNKLT